MPYPAQEKTYHPAVEEQERLIRRHGTGITLEVLNEMEVLHRNVQEAVRLHPPLILLLRQVHRDFTVTTSKGKSYVVPKASPSHTLLYLLHEKLFAEKTCHIVEADGSYYCRLL